MGNIFLNKNQLSNQSLIQLNYTYFLLLLLLINFVLVSALYLQVFQEEIPCPLCLLQRACYFGIGFGIFLNLRNGFSLRYEGLMQIITILLLIISVRQTLLDIYPRPGHEYIGSTILGLHMPVWSIIIAVLLLLTYAIKFYVLGAKVYADNISVYIHSTLKYLANVLIWFLILLCAFNLLLVLLQCGFEACHTEGYQWLEFFKAKF